MTKIISVFALTVTTMVLANPKGPQTIVGEASCANIDAHTLEVSVGKNTIIHWESFSIESNEMTRFIMPEDSSGVLNRVIGDTPSSILGTLEANGKVFLINSKGILVGEGATINTASFIASSFDILNENFLQGNHSFCFVDAAPIINLGNISAHEIQLISSEISNKGLLEGIKVKEENGRIRLYGSEIINHSGTIAAEGGEIYVLGKNILLLDNARIDVSADFGGGGTVLLGGDYQGNNPEIPNASHVFIHENGTISAHARIEGNGGKVIVWSDEQTHFFGKIDVRGGLLSGNGGFAEVSSANFLAYEGLTYALAPNGKVGKLFLDPVDVKIVDPLTASNTLSISGSSTSNVKFEQGCGTHTFCLSPQSSQNGVLNASKLSSQLQNGEVIVSSTGNLDLDSAFTQTKNSLTLQAQGDININDSLTLSGLGTSVEIISTDGNVNILSVIEIREANIDLTINAADTVTIDAEIALSSVNANLNISGSQINLYNSIIANDIEQAENITTITGDSVLINSFSGIYPIFIQSTLITISANDGDLTIQGGASSATPVQFLSKGPQNATNIILSASNDINLLGGTGVSSWVSFDAFSLEMNAGRDLNMNVGNNVNSYIGLSLYSTNSDRCSSNLNAMTFQIGRNWNINQMFSPPPLDDFVTLNFNGASFLGSVAGDIIWTGGTSQTNAINLQSYKTNTFPVVSGTINTNGIVNYYPCQGESPPPPPPPAPSPGP